ncbi:hypothetical protein SAY86_016766 [Trapa natans]|uniref:Uncharacterized protein n=1 Tax=Trapa natans TaxID=22666 RepID=A0AAN7LPC3_TRANT|nr:hypothetical protein SAY86_016766 [Trapa natans]
MISSESWRLDSSSSIPPSSENGGGGDEYQDVEMDFTAELTRCMAQFMLQEDEDDEIPLPSIGLFSEHYQSFSDFGGGFVGSNASWSSGDSPPLTPSTVPEADSDHGGEPYDMINRFQKTNLSKKGGYPRKNKTPSAQAMLQFSHHQNQVRRSNPATTSEDVSPRRMQLNFLPAPRMTGGWSHQRNQRTQQVSGSGMHVIFLRGPAYRSGSAGTGVFLPQGACSSTESRKQVRCSTALIPARVVKALMTHFQRAGSQQQQWTDGRSGSQFRQKSQSSAARNNNKDINLPQEWMY